MNAEERERYRIAVGLLKEPDGYYSTPSWEGALTSDTGRMEIIGYHSTKKAPALIDWDAVKAEAEAHYKSVLDRKKPTS